MIQFNQRILKILDHQSHQVDKTIDVCWCRLKCARGTKWARCPLVLLVPAGSTVPLVHALLEQHQTREEKEEGAPHRRHHRQHGSRHVARVEQEHSTGERQVCPDHDLAEVVRMATE